MTTSPSQCRRKHWLRCWENGFPKMNLIILKCDDRKYPDITVGVVERSKIREVSGFVQLC